MTSGIYHELTGKSGGETEIETMKLENGVLYLRGNSVSYESLTGYVARLEELDVFREVDYRGFTRVNPVTGNKDGGCYFELSCVLKESAS